jgi:hypothetical protein
MEQADFEDGSYPLKQKGQKHSNVSADPYRYQKEKFEQITNE